MKFLTLILVLIISTGSAQTINLEIKNACLFSDNVEIKPSCESKLNIKYFEMSSQEILRQTILKVLATSALSQQKLLIGTVDNLYISGLYCKPMEDQLPRILIGKKYVNDYWKAVGILLHELGHLLNHHENLCSNKQLELDADLFAGRCLALLKATKEQALSCMEIDQVAISSAIYPNKEERQNQLLIGYNNFFSMDNTMSFTSINPRVRWVKKQKVTEVYIDEVKLDLPSIEINKNRDGSESIIKHIGYRRNDKKGFSFDSQLGILYLDKNNSTYQLADFQNSSKGIGYLVNDKTPITYMRFGKRSFRIYNKAKIIPFKDVKDTITTGNDKDYEILYKVNINDTNYTKVVFVDYFFTPNGILRPAFYQ